MTAATAVIDEMFGTDGQGRSRPFTRSWVGDPVEFGADGQGWSRRWMTIDRWRCHDRTDHEAKRAAQ